MGTIRYTSIRKYFFQQFKDANAIELQNRKLAEEIRDDIRSYNEEISNFDAKFEALRPEQESAENLASIFKLGGQALPVNNPVKEKEDSLTEEKQNIQAKIDRLNHQYQDVLAKTGSMSDETYTTYTELSKSDFTSVRIRELSYFYSYENLDRNLAYIFVITHIENNNWERIETSYLEELTRIKTLGLDSSYEELRDLVQRNLLSIHLNGVVQDNYVRDFYNQFSEKKKQTLSYEVFCMSKIDMLASNTENGEWIAKKVNSFFVQNKKQLLGNAQQFTEKQAELVEKCLDYLMNREKNNEPVGTVLWNSIPLPSADDFFEGMSKVPCSDVDTSFVAWMHKYRRKLVSAFGDSYSNGWYVKYRELCASNNVGSDQAFYCRLAEYALKEQLKKEKYWNHVQFNSVVYAINHYTEETNPVLAEEFKQLREAKGGMNSGNSGSFGSQTPPPNTSPVHFSNISYGLTASHMVIIMFEMVVIACASYLGQSMGVLLIEGIVTSALGLLLLFLLHKNKKRRKRALTIVSSFPGFVINTIILDVLMTLLLQYMTWLGIDANSRFHGGFMGVVIYGIYIAALRKQLMEKRR